MLPLETAEHAVRLATLRRILHTPDLGTLEPIMGPVPGWGDPIQIKVSPGNEGDTEAWEERMKQQMAAQRAKQ
ncbi:MAG: hypothetical protein K8R59_02515 [Thermoanaerobaculales bacterium]|nr:hypothetical protein [Thermoanaerobaculales bacterium]